MNRGRTVLAARVVLASLIVLAGIGALAGCGAGGTSSATLYQCPMHPSYVSDRPGDCPICGMRLVPMKKSAGQPAPSGPQGQRPSAEPQATPKAQEAVYTCPMHPQIRRTEPGECPICGMKLVKVVGASESGAAGPPGGQPPEGGAEQGGTPGAAGHEAHGATGAAAASPAMTGTALDLGEAGARLAGVRTVAAVVGELSQDVRAVGTVVADETRVREITTKVPGFVEKLYVNATGQDVRAGQPLFELYSPELLASQEEYLRARQVAETFARSSLPEVRQGGLDLAKAARQRLELFDVPPEFLQRLDETGKSERRVVFKAPFSGVVTVKNVLEGQRIDTGMSLLTLTDLSRIWVIAQIYEAEAGAARLGRPAKVSLAYDPGTTLAGRLSFVYPSVDPDSRTLKVRLEFANPRGTLKPGMFVNVDLSTDRARGVIVPDSAIIDSGTRHVVYVLTSKGEFTPREVEVGLRGDGRALVRSGLREGDQVAVAANFLLDSETRLRSAAGLAGSGRDNERK